MRLFQIDTQELIESRGFVARRPGQTYVDPRNRSDKAVFQGLQYLPSQGKSYDSKEELLAALDDWESSADGKIYVINPNPNAAMKSAMIVKMDSDRGTEYFVLFLKNLDRLEGKLINIPAGLISAGHGGYVMDRDVTYSERAGVKPADVVSGDAAYSINQIPKLLDKARSTAGDEPVDQMQGYLKALAAGNGMDHVIKDGAKFASLHQKYLGEWASPIALITGQFDPAAQLKEIEDAMLGGNSIRGSKVTYSSSTTETLFDSAVVQGDRRILISSKARTGGAAASLKGLHDTIKDKVDEIPASFWRNKKARKFRKIVEEVMDKPAIDGVLSLAVQEDLIGQADASAIKSAIASGAKDYKPSDMVTDYMADYNARTDHPQYNAGKHALAAVAMQLVNKLNDEDYTNVVKELLNYANIVQMYFKASPKGNDLICKGFDLVWPPQFDGKIVFYSGKNFSATDIKGRLGFKIGKGAAIIPEPDSTLKAPIDTKAQARAARAAEKAAELKVGKVTRRGERDVRLKSVPDVVALGRARKKR